MEPVGYTVTVIDCLLGCASFFTVAGGKFSHSLIWIILVKSRDNAMKVKSAFNWDENCSFLHCIIL